MGEGQRVRITRLGERPQGGLVHQRANGEMREEKAPGLLLHELRRLAAEDPLRAAQMGLELVERRLHLPPLVVERGQFRGRRARGIEERRDEPRRPPRGGHAGQRVFDHAHRPGRAVGALALGVSPEFTDRPGAEFRHELFRVLDLVVLTPSWARGRIWISAKY